jgi:transposase-like protein
MDDQGRLDFVIAADEQRTRSIQVYRAQRTYPMVAQSWHNVWANVIPLFKFLDDIRRAIYTTDAIESINASIRHIASLTHLPQNSPVWA